MRFEEWLLGLSRTAQYIIAVVMLGISTITFAYGGIWPWGWIFGLILLAWSCFGPSRPKENDDTSD
jgi:hypothetical protein